jgi:hypothetical protein
MSYDRVAIGWLSCQVLLLSAKEIVRKRSVADCGNILRSKVSRRSAMGTYPPDGASWLDGIIVTERFYNRW